MTRGTGADGLAAAVCIAALDAARALGAGTAIVLAVTCEARALYRAIGFAEVGPLRLGSAGRRPDSLCRPMTDAVTMDKIVSLCRRRGFVFPSSEIYGGLGSSYDYGHYGVLLKDNVKAALAARDGAGARRHRRARLVDHPPPAGLGGVRATSAASRDPLVDCRFCKQRFRADHLERGAVRPAAEQAARRDVRLRPHRGAPVQPHVRDARRRASRRPASDVYLRPETAQGIFINFKNVAQIARRKPPFGIAQIGKSFRNEITPGNFIFRTLEFEQMEMEFFVPPAEAERVVPLLGRRAARAGTCGYGIRESHLRIRPHDADELSHYSSGTSDIEYLFPIGWSELEGVANRGDFDLTAHTERLRDEARVGRRRTASATSRT